MSHKLDLDLIQPLPFSLSTFTWYGLSFLCIGFIFAIFTWQNYQARLIAHTEIVLKLSELNRKFQQAVPLQQLSKDILPETKLQIETTVSALTAPWGELLKEIESADIQDVALLSLEPSTKKQQVLVTGEAKNLSTVFRYIDQLEQQSMLAQVYLQKHSVVEADPFRPVKFTLTAQWRKAE